MCLFLKVLHESVNEHRNMFYSKLAKHDLGLSHCRLIRKINNYFHGNQRDHLFKGISYH